jgi:hypothetical protein
LCSYRSNEDAIIDFYILNRSPATLVFRESIIGTGGGTGPIAGLARWILPPPPLICPGQTRFLRLYSGQVSTSLPTICDFPVQLGAILRYEIQNLPHSQIELDVFRVRPASMDDCQLVPEFRPVEVQSYDSQSAQVEIFWVRPPNHSADWNNTLLFLLA